MREIRINSSANLNDVDPDGFGNVRCAFNIEQPCTIKCAALEEKKDNTVWCLRGHFNIGKKKV